MMKSPELYPPEEIELADSYIKHPLRRKHCICRYGTVLGKILRAK